MGTIATITLTGKTASEVAALGRQLQAIGCDYSDEKKIETLTVTDASPIVVTHTRPNSNSGAAVVFTI